MKPYMPDARLINRRGDRWEPVSSSAGITHKSNVCSIDPRWQVPVPKNDMNRVPESARQSQICLCSALCRRVATQRKRRHPVRKNWRMIVPLDAWRQHIATLAPGVAGQLADAMCSTAIHVGGYVAAGNRYGVKPGEEGITESVLISLSSQIPRLRVRQLSHGEEAEQGADWEWWIQGGQKWFGFLVQAKRIQPMTRERDGYNIGYRPDPKSDGLVRDLQVDSLISAAEFLGIPAIYALYNESGAGHQYTRPQFGRECCIPIGGDGVTALGAHAARWLHGLERGTYVGIDSVAPFAFPWSCLAYCLLRNDHGAWPDLPIDLAEQLGFDPDTDVADLAYAAARFVLEVERAPRRNQFSLDTAERVAADVLRLASAVHDEPPWYAPIEGGPSDNDFAATNEHHPLAAGGLAPKFVATLSLPRHLDPRSLDLNDDRY